jgi:dihydrofolate reductase
MRLLATKINGENEMRKIIVSEFLTLDGVMEDPGGSEGGKHGGWQMPFFDADAGKFKYDELFASDALLLGRVTYEGFAKAWPTMKDTGDFGERMNSITKYVVSTTLDKAKWNNSKLIKSNVAEEIGKLKQQEGQNILIAGSGQLIHFLRQHDLIDQYRLLVYPIVLGSGKRLFRDAVYSKLKLVESKSFSSGAVALVYETERKA